MDTGHNGIVVGGETERLTVELDFARGIVAFLGCGRLTGCPVAEGEDPITIDGEMGREEDMIDTAGGFQIGTEGVEGAVFTQAEGGCLVAVGEMTLLGEDGIDFVGLIDVEIAGEDGGKAVGDGIDLAYHQLSPLTTGFDTDMIHVEVEEEEMAP